jgi:hypothetical protein
VAGTANTGGGGGGAYGAGTSGAGGSGVVIIRYPDTYTQQAGGTITQAGGYWIHTFNANGTFTVS